MRRPIPKKHRPYSGGVLYHPATVYYDETARTAQGIIAGLAVNREKRRRSDNKKVVRVLKYGWSAE